MNKIVYKFSHRVKEFLGNSDVSDYLVKYLRNINAKTYVVEDKYIDRDYMIDYQKFYSRSFKNHKRFTKRIHFFKEEFSESKFREHMENNTVEDLKNSYLGFIVVKPIFDKQENPLLGRTLLEHFLEKDGEKKRYFINPKTDVSLFGIPMKINSLPFQMQDRGVSACATISLWTCLFPLLKFFEIRKHSPAEITSESTLFPAPLRKFPSSGLSLEQILNYMGIIGLDAEILIKPEGNIITLVANAYIKDAQLPVMALLKLSSNNREDYHAAVISGYKCNEQGIIEELYVHDDQIGPYSKVKPIGGDFKSWENEWITKYGYEKVTVDYLIIPLYPKIRLTFPRIYAYYENYCNAFQSFDDIRLELFLTYVQKYRKFLIKTSIREKWNKLTNSLPRFIWIVRIHLRNEILIDTIFDATAVYPKSLMSIEFL